MAFHVGQKVVCVSEPVPSEIQGIKAGGIYTIRSIERCPLFDVLGFRLEEVLCGATGLPGHIEGGFRATHFRPVIERKTDISIFTAMLTPQRASEHLNSVAAE